MGPFDVSKVKNYVKELENWLSASVSYEQTCLDGFNSVKGDAGDKMKNFLKQSQELTKNGLAMISEISKLMGGAIDIKTQRRLLADGDSSKTSPSWIDGRKLDLSTASASSLKPDVVVAQDGSGKYKTVGEALKDIPKESPKTFVIYIKEGEYKEHVVLEKEMKNVMFIGDGLPRLRSPVTRTLPMVPIHSEPQLSIVQIVTRAVVIGDYFIAKDMGFENSAGAKGHQAMALRVQSDQSFFYNCQMDGYQNTLFTQTYRQFYRDRTISGAVDIIFGDAAVVFQNCKMIIRKPEGDDKATVTAQERSDKRQPTAIVFPNSTISADKEYKDKTAFLGRPAHTYSRTVVMQSQIDDVISPEGWIPWTGQSNSATLKNAGSASSQTGDPVRPPTRG
ncbi:hypothetical protein ACLB2K_042124 [Fragaria x ananassa]